MKNRRKSGEENQYWNNLNLREKENRRKEVLKSDQEIFSEQKNMSFQIERTN